MADMWLTVCGWRSIIEYIWLAAFTHLNTLLKNVFIFPELFDFFFSFHKLKVCGDFVIHPCFPPFLNLKNVSQVLFKVSALNFQYMDLSPDGASP